MAAKGPQLPDSPLRALEDGVGDPRLGSWRRIGLGIAGVLLATFLVGAFSSWGWAFWAFGPTSWQGVVNDPQGAVLALLWPAPNLLLSLVGIHMLFRPGRVSALVSAAGSAAAVVCALGHTYIGPAADQIEAVYLAYGLAGLAGDVLAVVAVNRACPARWTDTVAIVALTVPSGMVAAWGTVGVEYLIGDLVVGYPPAVWHAASLLTSGVVPILGAGAVIWMIHTRPQQL